MSPSARIRALTAILAVIHLFPARKHLGLLLDEPTFTDAWKGIGAALAVILFLLPPAWQARAMGGLWRDRHAWLRAGTWALAVLHVVPATHHLPLFLQQPSWADGWRGVGAVMAVAFLAAPLRWQAGVVSRAWQWARRASALPA